MVSTHSPGAGQALEPRYDLLEGLGRELIDASPAVTALDHQTQLAQNPQMFRDRRTAHRKAGGDLADCQSTGAQALDDASASRIRQTAQTLEIHHSNHLVTDSTLLSDLEVRPKGNQLLTHLDNLTRNQLATNGSALSERARGSSDS